MKKILSFCLVLLTMTIYSKYSFEIKNPYAATIMGSTLMTSGQDNKKLPIKEYRIALPETTKFVPDNLWFHDKYNFSLLAQKGPAPLVFLIAGTGSTHNSSRMKNLGRDLYEAGFSVIGISSQFNQNFLVTASSSKLPGSLMDDARDVYQVMKKCYEHVEKKLDVTDFSVVGYSLGATDAAFVSYIDESEKYFDFKRVYMINPAVDLYDSALILDSYVGRGNEAGEKIMNIIDFISYRASSVLNDEYRGEFTEDSIFRLFANAKLTDEQMRGLIGTVFRITAIDVNYICDVMNKRHVYTKYPVKKFEKMFKYFKRMNFASFGDYLEKILYPTIYEKEGITLDELKTRTTLRSIKDYLSSSDKIVAVTNADELILTNEEIDFLRKTFGNRMILFPEGGHCGNMEHPVNVSIMLNYLITGVFKYEE